MKIPFTIGVTGGIGSGKSSFCEIFKDMGIPVFSGDLQVRAMMNESRVIRRSVIKHFGPSAYVDGELDRKFIASIVFNDKKKLELLNSITLPHLWRRFHKWCRRQTSPCVMMESATLIEHGGQDHVDHILVVTAPLEMRIERTMKRDNSTREQVEARIGSQISEKERLNAAQTVIHNDGDAQHLLAQAIEFKKYLSLIP